MLDRENKTNPEIPFLLDEEYNRAVRVLNRYGVISFLPNSEKMGILSDDGTEYPVPSLEQVRTLFEANKKIIEEKQKQGFTKLLITPLACPINRLILLLDEALIIHQSEGKLFTSQSTPEHPVPVTKYRAFQFNTRLKTLLSEPTIYFPDRFIENMTGKPKQNVLKDPAICAVDGWSISLIEDMKQIPYLEKGKTIAGRKQLTTGKNSLFYLQHTSQTKQYRPTPYQHETGWTIEDFLTNTLLTLASNNTISHELDYANAVWLLGSYIPEQDLVPYATFSDHTFLVMHSFPLSSYDQIGCRTAVRLGR